MSNQQRAKALAPLRLAIKGWAFTSPENLPSYIARGEAERDLLPEELRAEADALIQPVRDACA